MFIILGDPWTYLLGVGCVWGWKYSIGCYIHFIVKESCLFIMQTVHAMHLTSCEMSLTHPWMAKCVQGHPYIWVTVSLLSGFCISTALVGIMQEVRCSAIIMHSVFSKILTILTPYSSPLRARYSMCVMSSKFYLFSMLVTALLS